MAQDDISHYIPRRLDDPPKLLFFDRDVGMVAVIMMGMGVSLNYPITGIVIGGILGFFLNKFKAGQHPGMTTHYLYWISGVPVPKALPPSHVRELNG